jgi:chromate transporter
VAGLGFVLPACLIVLLLAIAYEQVGSQSGVRWLLYGMAPVVIAVIAHALLTLTPTAISGVLTAVVAIAATGLTHVGWHPISVLVGGASVLLVARRGPAWWRDRREAMAIVVVPVAASSPDAAVAAGAVVGIGLSGLFLLFLKLGLVVFGSGYVLIAFLQTDLVDPGWLTQQQLLDAIAIGQVTPGPVFTSATFIGYLLAGVPGAIVATVGIFLPAFVLVGTVHPFLGRLRSSVTLASAMEGLNAAAIGLIAAAALPLARDAFVDALTVILGVGAFALLLVGRLGPVPLLVGGALVGFVAQALRV